MADPGSSELIAPELRPVYAAARARDIDRYLSALLAPPEVRDALVAVAAFAGEAAHIPLAIADPTLALIRLQWWRDALDVVLDGGRTGSPVADALGDALSGHPDFGAAAGDILEARMELCEIAQPGPVADVVALYAAAETATFRLAAGVAGCGGILPEQTLELAGAAYGTTRALLVLPHHLAAGRCSVSGNSDGRSALAEHIGSARTHLADARRELRQAAIRGCFRVFLPLALVEPYLRALERGGHDALRQLAGISPLTRVGRLAWARWRGRI